VYALRGLWLPEEDVRKESEHFHLVNRRVVWYWKFSLRSRFEANREWELWKSRAVMMVPYNRRLQPSVTRMSRRG